VRSKVFIAQEYKGTESWEYKDGEFNFSLFAWAVANFFLTQVGRHLSNRWKEVPIMAQARFTLLLFTTVLLATSAHAQDQAAGLAGVPGCGDPSTKFSLNTASGQQPARPEAGKALIYFIEDDSNFRSFPKPTTRAGVDGTWVGATHGSSYFSFSVDPGVHHLCASWQSGVILGRGRKTAAAHFTAEAGSTYYFEVKNVTFSAENSMTVDMSLTPLDSDEGALLAGQYEPITSQLKK
jgi:hypothetical protein